ncbi:G-type lectin S-receptor-like serine/threonine-protein kinase RKS1 [Linum perenne]
MKGFWVSGRYVLIPLFLILKSLICTSVAKDTLEATQFIEDGSILISQGGMFALGFFSPGSSSSNRYLGIWYHKVTVQTVVWVANRNTPINGTSGVLSLDEHGSLVLYSSHDLRAPVWFANASSLSPDAYVAQLLDSGNLVLLQGTRRRIVWQSFDYPTDVALPGMKIGLNLKTGLDRSLTCWKSPNDPGIGDYSFKLDPRGSPQFFLQTRADHYWRSGPWPWGKFPDIYNYTFVNNEDEIYFSFSVNDKSLLLRTVIDDSGTMKRLSWHGIDGQWKEYWSAPKYRCDSYGRCGVYSICDPNNVNMFECTCLPNYEPRNPSMWHLRDGSGGCVRKRLPSSAFCAPGEGFLRVVDIKIPDTSSAVWISRSTSQVACEEACRRNCSCSAYSMKYIQGKQSGCLAWYGELQDTVVFKDSGDDLFVRVDARELGKLLSSDNMRKFSGDVELKIKLGIAVPSVASVLFAMAIFGYFRLRSWKREKEVLGGSTIYPELPFYDLGSILIATNSFSLANKIGEGGFGTVYKGQLSNGQEVAVKRLSRSSDQGIQELKNELLLIARLQHRNLVKLLGCCIEDDEQILVYEYVPNKSLDSFIFDETKRPLLNWRTRFNILVGIARGILYLHQDSRFRIIHRDLKSSNILLDEEMNPKISDFGLAKMFDSDQTQNKTTRVVGTYGYMSPEYAVFGKFSVKSDVFSFGIILLEVFSGMKINSFSQELPPRTLIGHVWELWRENRVLELMDPSLKESCVPEEVLRCVHVGLLCVQENATDRPNMSAVVLMLNSETPLPRPNKPAFIFRVVDSMLGTVGGVDGPYSINDLTLTRVLAR